MKNQVIIISLVCLFLTSCASSKSKATPQQIENLKALVELKKIHIESDWAYPMTTYAVQQVLSSGLLPPWNTANRISLIGNSNFLEIKGDSVTSYLPYFGERQMNVQYGGKDNAIQFNGLMEDYSIEEIKNNNYRIKFNAKSNNEMFQVILTLTPGLSTDLILNSGSRRTIRYSGKAESAINE